MRITSKQRTIMTVLVRGNPDGSFCDLDQLIERIDYKTTKASMQFSIRALIKNGFLIKQPREKRRGRSHVIISPTKKGYETFGPESTLGKDVIEALGEKIAQ